MKRFGYGAGSSISKIAVAARFCFRGFLLSCADIIGEVAEITVKGRGMSEISCENIFQDHYDFWSHLSDKQKTYLISHTHEVHYKRGETLHYGGDDCIGVILIASGMFRIYLLSDEGRDVTLFRLYDHDVCMLSASCALDAVTFDVHIDAESETVGYLIEAAAFRQLMNENIYVKS